MPGRVVKEKNTNHHSAGSVNGVAHLYGEIFAQKKNCSSCGCTVGKDCPVLLKTG
jgi:hypothetical protein